MSRGTRKGILGTASDIQGKQEAVTTYIPMLLEQKGWKLPPHRSLCVLNPLLFSQVFL